MYERSKVMELVVKVITKRQSKSQVKTRTIFLFCFVLFSAACSLLFGSLQSHRPQPTKLLCPWNFPGKNTQVDCQFLLQGIFLTQGLNPHLLHLLHWRLDFFPPLAPPKTNKIVLPSTSTDVALCVYKMLFYFAFSNNPPAICMMNTIIPVL